MEDKESISNLMGSTKFYQRTDDSLKDEDNVAWVMELDKNERKDWITILQWIRIPDRLIENDRLTNSRKIPVSPETPSFDDFKEEWYKLRNDRSINEQSQFAPLFKNLKNRWEFEQLGEQELSKWDLYLKSLSCYIRPNLRIDDMQQYENALYGLSGTFFQAFPHVPRTFYEEAGILGTLDQFYNNLRDLYEDTKRQIYYFPTTLLNKFEIDVNEQDLLVSKPDERFSRMIDYLLTTFVSEMKNKVSPLLTTNSLHYSWQLMLKNIFKRYSRIEYVFRLCNYNAEQFSVEYWNHVRADLDPEISLKFLDFKGSLKI